MSAGREIDLALHVELTEPIRGYLRSEGGGVREFSGWLEFNSTLQHLVEEASPAGEGSEESSHQSR